MHAILGRLCLSQARGQAVAFQLLAVWADVEISLLVIVKISFGKSAILALALITNDDMGSNASIDQPTKKLVGSVSGIGGQVLGLET